MSVSLVDGSGNSFKDRQLDKYLVSEIPTQFSKHGPVSIFCSFLKYTLWVYECIGMYLVNEGPTYMMVVPEIIMGLKDVCCLGTSYSV